MSWFTKVEEHALSLFVKAGHSPELGKDGKPDEMAFDIDDPEGWGGHNGYRCSKCGEVICVWCANIRGYSVHGCKP